MSAAETFMIPSLTPRTSEENAGSYYNKNCILCMHEFVHCIRLQMLYVLNLLKLRYTPVAKHSPVQTRGEFSILAHLDQKALLSRTALEEGFFCAQSA